MNESQVNGFFSSIFSTLLPGAQAKLVPPENQTFLEGGYITSCLVFGVEGVLGNDFILDVGGTAGIMHCALAVFCTDLRTCMRRYPPLDPPKHGQLALLPTCWPHFQTLPCKICTYVIKSQAV